MKIKVKETAVVKPTPAKPRTTIWISNLDAILPENYHTRTHYFYLPTAAADFFDAAVLKATLARTLSEFHPMAGRLKKDGNGRVEIDCKGEGAVFVEAEADGVIDDLGDFSPNPNICLAPKVDDSQGISSFPLLLVQITRFKCGGVCLGVAMDHQVKDGISALHIIHTWCDIARGLDIAVPPYMDRRVLAAREPPQPKFEHVEFHPPPPLKNSEAHTNGSETKFAVLKLTREQLIILKGSSQEDDGKRPPYSSFEALTGRGLQHPPDPPPESPLKSIRACLEVHLQSSSATGRSRNKADYYSRRLIEAAAPIATRILRQCGVQSHTLALSGEVEWNPLKYAVCKVREALTRMDDDYLRSAIDYLEVKGGLGPNARGTELYKSPNLGITSWARLPFYEADFGWGRPFHVGLGAVPAEGHLIVMPSPANDGGLRLAIALPQEQMKIFEKIFYEI